MKLRGSETKAMRELHSYLRQAKEMKRKFPVA